MTTKTNTKSTKSIGPITVEVTALDIKRGTRNTLSQCPIARAIRRLKFKDVSIGGTARFTKGSGKNALRLVFDIPKAASTFIGRFDLGKPVKPFTFTVRKLLNSTSVQA